MSDQPERFVCPTDHKHAASLWCYTGHGCRCEDCRGVRHDYDQNRAAAARPRKYPLAKRAPRTVSTGTVRRLRGLVVLGYAPERIARELTVDPSLLWYLLIAPPVSVSERFAARSLRVFQRLAAGGICADKDADLARRVATNLGWPSAYAYHDIDTSPEPRP